MLDMMFSLSHSQPGPRRIGGQPAPAAAAAAGLKSCANRPSADRPPDGITIRGRLAGRIAGGAALLLLACSTLRAGAQPQTPFPATDPLLRAFTVQNVYVGKTYAGKVDVTRLNVLAAREPKDRPLKIIVAKGLPPDGKPYRTALRYLRALFARLDLKKGVLLDVAPTGMLAVSGELSPIETQDLIDLETRRPAASVTDGIEQTVKAFDTAAKTHFVPPPPEEHGITHIRESTVPPVRRRQHEDTGPPLVAFLVVPALAVICMSSVISMFVLAIMRGRAVSSLSKPVDTLRMAALADLSYADGMRSSIPDSADAQEAWRQYQIATLLVEESSALARKTAGPADFKRAEMLLQQAVEKARACRMGLEAIVGADHAPAGANPSASETGPSGR
jgi:hypothetical protein